jgi:methanogenic corrinoid protein MtbC1
MAVNEKIVKAMTDLEEEDLFREVKAAISAGTPATEILEALQLGLTNVGDLFAKSEYFLSELMMSAEMFAECQKLFGDVKAAAPKYGAAVIGTVAGDIHDIGKNIAVSLFQSNGFKVIDVGVDAPVQAFIDAIKANDPKIVGLSCLLTVGFDAMKETIAQIRKQGLDKGRLILIGGGPVEEGTVKYVNADGMSKSAQEGVLRAIEFVGKNR